MFSRPDSAPIGGPEGHARCFSAVMSANVSKDFQIPLKNPLFTIIHVHINFL